MNSPPPIPVSRNLLSTALWLALFATQYSGSLSAQTLDEDRSRIEKEYGMPFADIVRLNYWSVFERGNEFAQELGISRERFDALMNNHEWQLGRPSALAMQNALDSEQAKVLKRITASSKEGLVTGAFICLLYTSPSPRDS